ncbi:FAD/NAD(P)-binding domain-containing protein [Periconia macrospinosa]|uniref:FAD/NAD(P)-binding domain-containing protein n=1 Tax=Periconia macrospinosa TaxID=97972 RepID=A0A2V1DDS1_9PLEO|nr:FAD/NAD(P)-binding domain-containing protein [Periconia macrospinosa]
MEMLCAKVEYTVYENNSDIGGTWFENRYPGCACDVPSHCYSYHFPEWPKFLSSREDIWQYLDPICKVFDLRRNMKFNSEVIEARWDEESAIWRVRVRKRKPNGMTRVSEDTCDVLWYNSALLNQWNGPEVEVRIMHSANWQDDFH